MKTLKVIGLAALIFIISLIPMFLFALFINSILAGISYNLLVYHHPQDWGAESLIGSAMIWTPILSLIATAIAAFFISKVK